MPPKVCSECLRYACPGRAESQCKLKEGLVVSGNDSCDKWLYRRVKLIAIRDLIKKAIRNNVWKSPSGIVVHQGLNSD